MRKLSSLLICIALVLCGCSQNENAEQNVGKDYPAYFEYEYESQTLENFTVSDDGRLIMTKVKDLYSADLTCEFVEYDMDGNSKVLCETTLWPNCLAFMGNEFYISGSSGGKVHILKFDLETGEYSVCAEISSWSCMALNGNNSELYVLCGDRDKDEAVKELPFGTQAASVYRICDGNVEKIDVLFPTAVCAKREGGAIIAAYDENGCYITEYDNGAFSEKVYANASKDFMDFTSISDLAEVDGEHIVYTTYTPSGDFMLCASSKNNMYIAELIPGKNTTRTIFSAGGYCFFQSAVSEEFIAENGGSIGLYHAVERIKFSDYYKFNEPLTLICSEYSGYTPFGCGYTINMTKPSNEETALKILSQDKDYDLCYLSTRDDISYAIKSKGSFYPLNKVEGVSEYLDKCFPAIKSAFTDENGNIWAIPLSSNSLYIMSNCGDENISEMTLNEFVDYFDGLSDEDMKKVDYSAYTYTEVVLADYLTKHDSFDTEEFRAAAEKLKGSKRLNMSKEKMFSRSESSEKLVGMCFNDNMKLENYSKDYDVSGIPCIGGKNTLVPNVIFLSVNPSSSHFEDAPDYIKELVKFQSEKEDALIFEYEKGNYSESATVKQMTELLSKAELHFAYPSELYWGDFRKYLADEISLDDFIKEADRKLRTYLKE